jgi:Ca2+-binding EF-hand superfamily protein
MSTTDYQQILKGLQKKELELQAALEAINQSFEDLGLGLSTVAVNQDEKLRDQLNEVQRSGIRIHSKLSFRGKEKTREYFRLLDRDCDGYISYENIRGN